MKSIIQNLIRSGFASALILGLCSCATTDPGGGAAGTPWKTTSDGIPIGRWKTEIRATLPPLKLVKTTVVLTLKPDGTGYREITMHYEFPPGISVAHGKFKGTRVVKWTDRKTVGKVKRIGDKIYFYGDPNANAQLLEGYPPGYTLHDYETLGGAAPQGIDATSGSVGVTILLISGKNLILTNSTDNNRWLYKWIGQ